MLDFQFVAKSRSDSSKFHHHGAQSIFNKSVSERISVNQYQYYIIGGDGGP